MAKAFIKNNTQKENFSKVLFILEKDIDIDYNISTQVDVGKLSINVDEDEVLFLPFSSFKIENIEKEKNLYKIKLKYLAKYIKIHEKNLKTISKNNIPDDSEFKKEIFGSNLIKIEEKESINVEELVKEYNMPYFPIKSKLNISNPIIDKKPDYIIRRIKMENKDRFYKILASNQYTKPKPSSIIITPDENYITGYIKITDKDLNKKIRIINSFEQSKRRYNYIKGQNELKYNNEKEIMNKCEIEINGNKLNGFTYLKS